LHGEAVSIGMAQAFRFSERLGLSPPAAHLASKRILKSVGLPVTRLAAIRQHLPGADGLVEMMRQDKKASAGKITFILVKGVGDAYIDKSVDEAELKLFLEDELNLK
jgi:3-dehydroquinate synthase